MEINCPKCNYTITDVDESLSHYACDDTDIQCEICGHEFSIGWTAEVEIRDSKLSEGN